MNSDTVVATVKSILPTRFLTKTEAGDTQLAAYVTMCLNDINIVPPLTSYTIANAPASWEQVLVFGCNTYATFFVYLGYTLKDFNWSDGGVTIQPGRVEKLSAAYDRAFKQYTKSIYFLKKAEIFKVKPKGVGSISYQMAGASPSNTMSGLLRSQYGINLFSPNDASTGY